MIAYVTRIFDHKNEIIYSSRFIVACSSSPSNIASIKHNFTMFTANAGYFSGHNIFA